MDFHVLTPAGPELLMYVVDGELIIVPAPGSVQLAAPTPPTPSAQNPV